MENDVLPTVGPDADLEKMAPLNQRRSITFMNNFISNTADFLNKFSNMASEKLAQQSLEMQRIEIALSILEAKLASIPGLESPTQEDRKPPTVTENQEVAPQSEPNASAEPDKDPIVEKTTDPNVILVKNDARYMKYLKMVNVGVPKVAVSNKMILEGLDPDLLDTPDAPVPDGGFKEESEESDNESQSLSSDDNFSD